MIRGIAHVAYTVADMNRSLDFYCNILGFRHAFDIPDEKGEPWIEYVKIKDGQFIELFYGGTTGAVTSSYAHLCLEVDDIHEVSAHLKEKGVDVYSGPTQGADLNWQCWAKDPDGNPIEFMQIHPDSPQKRA